MANDLAPTAIAAITRYSSLSGLIASLATLVFLWWHGERELTQLFLALTVLLWITHRANIARLIAGTEGKIGN
jgi:glycerol-3-phosphate acyltransferase PlsY